MIKGNKGFLLVMVLFFFVGTGFWSCSSSDSDGSDGTPNETVSVDDRDNDGDGHTENQGDCDDGDPARYPGAVEICEDGIDQDCSGDDLSCDDFDNDGDAYTENQGDCDDTDGNVHPGASEICNTLDDNCNNEIDEGLAVSSYYRDADGDGFGDQTDMKEGCTPPPGYVLNDEDCDDTSAWWWRKDGTAAGNCALYGNISCTHETRYDEACHPPIDSMIIALNEFNLGESYYDLNKDKFEYPDHMVMPGASTGRSTTHLQSIQYFNIDGKPDPPDGGYLVVSMSDQSDDQANISIVKVNEFGSEDGENDVVISQLILSETDMGTKRVYNHPGGSQMIGEYVFIALEDFARGLDGDDPDRMRPKIGVWRVKRENEVCIGPLCMPMPILEFKYLVDPYMGHPDWFDPSDPDWFDASAPGYTGEPWDKDTQLVSKNISTAAVAKLEDGTYLLAACVQEDCKSIVFLKSKNNDLSEDPEFTYIDEWKPEEELRDPEGNPVNWDNRDDFWPDCAPQNMNFVVERINHLHGTIHLIVFGMDKGLADTCGLGNGTENLYTYLVTYNEGEIDLTFKDKTYIQAGDSCGGIAVNGTNFDAGAGLWIAPLGNTNRISVLATEHYNSCGDFFDGKSRWGVTGNWDN